MTTPPGPTGRARSTSGEADPLVQALNHVGDSVRALVVDSRKRDRRMVVLLGVIVFLVAAIGAIVVDNRLRSGTSRQILRTIEDCTSQEAPGDCHERNQARTAAYLTELAATEFDIAWCVKISDTKAEAERCVTAARQARHGR
jgi:hypothetical protein